MSNIIDITKLEPMKITFEKYMSSSDFMKLPSDQQTNCVRLLQKVSSLLEEFGEEREMTSGYRSMEDHLRIYKEINEKRKKQGLPELKVPMASRHLIAAAIDIADADGKLDAFCTDKILEKYDLYREHPDHTKGWCHLQVLPPKSSKRTFIP